MRAATAIVLLTSIAAALLSACGQETNAPAAAPHPVAAQTKPAESRPAPAAPVPAPPPADVAGRRCRIRGTALVDGAPVTAHVELRRLGDVVLFGRNDDPAALAAPPLASTEAGADGSFEFTALPTGEYVLLVRHGTTHSAERYVELRADGTVAREQMLLLDDTSCEALRGRVIDADGAPFRGWVGANLPPRLQRRGACGVRWAPTSADGRFELTGLPVAAIELRVSRGRGSNLPGPIVDTASVRETEVRLADALRSIEVRVVTAAGAAVADARVSLGWGKFQDESSDAMTVDATGTVRLAGPRNTDANVVARAPGFLESRVSVPPGEARVVVALEPAARVKVRVVDASTGAPAAGALVYPTTSVGSRYPDDLGGKRADSDGLVEFDSLPPDATAFRVMGGGWFSADIVAAARPDPAARDESVVPFTHAAPAGAVTEIRAVRAGSIRGRVISADGRPAPGVLVSPRSSPGPWNRNGNWPDVATDADGRFAVTDLVPGELVALNADDSAYADEPQVTAVASADAPPDVELRFSPGGWVTVEVRDADTDAALGGTSVACRPPKDKNSFLFTFRSTKEALTGADGSARVGPMVPGTYEVTASRRGYAQGPKLRVTEADFVEGAQRTLVVRLPRGVSITGRVLHADGSPARGYTVFVRGRDLDEDSPFGDHGDDVGADGSFEVPDMEPGQYTLDVGRFFERGGTSAGAVAGGSPVEIRLRAPDEERPQPAREVEDAPRGAARIPSYRKAVQFLVRVEAPDGVDLSSLVVRAWNADDWASWSVQEGYAVLPLTVAGGKAMVRSAWSDRGMPPGTGETLVDLPAEPQSPLTIRIAPDRTVRGRVLDESGRPVSDVRVRAVPDVGVRLHGDDVEGGPTGSDGTFELRGLGGFAYRLRAAVPLGFLYPASTPLDATAGEVTLRVRRGEGPLVRVLDDEGRPLAGAVVSVQTPEFDELPSISADGAGHARLPSLPTDEPCRLYVSPPKEREDLLAFSDGEWTPSPERIVRLSRAFRVGGSVVDWTGAPVAGIAVHASQAPGDDERGASWRSKTTDDGGAFLFDRVAEGPVRLVAGDFASHVSGGMNEMVFWSIDEPGALLRASAEVAAGTTTARLVLPRATCLEVRLVGWQQGRDLPDAPRLATADGKHTHRGIQSGDRPLLFSGLEKDREYSLFVRVENRNLVGYATGLRAGGTAELQLVPGLALEGRVRWPAAATAPRLVSLRLAGQELAEVVRAGGAFRFECLPPAACELEAFEVGADGTIYRGHATAEPRKPVTIEMTEWEER